MKPLGVLAAHEHLERVAEWEVGREGVVDDGVDDPGSCGNLEQRCQYKGDAPCLRTGPDDVPRHQLFVGGVQDSDVDVRQAKHFRRRHGSLEPEPSRPIGADTAAPARAIAVRACLPQNDKGAGNRSAVRAEDASVKYVACADLPPPRGREPALLERTCAVTLRRPAGCRGPWRGER
jgi:hypothetical protein